MNLFILFNLNFDKSFIFSLILIHDTFIRFLTFSFYSFLSHFVSPILPTLQSLFTKLIISDSFSYFLFSIFFFILFILDSLCFQIFWKIRKVYYMKSDQFGIFKARSKILLKCEMKVLKRWMLDP